MLIIGRKKNGCIIFDERITVKILSIDGGEVKLGILAPQEVQIRRDEIDPATRRRGTKTPAIDLPLKNS